MGKDDSKSYEQLQNDYCDGDQKHTQLINIIHYFENKQHFQNGKNIFIDSRYGMGKKYFLKTIKAYFEEKEQNKCCIFSLDLNLIDQFDTSLVLFILLYNIQLQNEKCFTKADQEMYKEALKKIYNIVVDIFQPLKNIQDNLNDIEELIKYLYSYKKLSNDKTFTNNAKYNQFQIDIKNFQKELKRALKGENGNKYVIYCINNIDLCDETFAYDTLKLLNSYFSGLDIPFGIVALGDYSSIENNFKKRKEYEQDAYNLFDSLFRKTFILPLPDYSTAVAHFYPKKENSSFDEDVLETLKQISFYYQPKLSQLKRMIEGILEYIEMNPQIKEYDYYIVRNIILLSAIKYFKYDEFRKLYETHNDAKKEVIEQLGIQQINGYLYNALKSDDDFLSDVHHKLYRRLDDDLFWTQEINIYEDDQFEVISEQDGKFYFKITSEKEKKVYKFYCDQSSSIDHVIPFSCLNQLHKYIKQNVMFIYLDFCGII